jgi:hypothetical protein
VKLDTTRFSTSPKTEEGGSMINKTVDQVREELQSLYQEWFMQVPPDGDSEFLKKILSEDWVYINYIGEVRGKAEYLEYIKPVPLSARPRDVSDLKVRIFGDIVLVHGRYLAPGVGEDGSVFFRYGLIVGGHGKMPHHTTITLCVILMFCCTWSLIIISIFNSSNKCPRKNYSGDKIMRFRKSGCNHRWFPWVGCSVSTPLC